MDNPGYNHVAFLSQSGRNLVTISSLQQGSGGVGEVRSKAKSKARLRLRLKATANIDSHASPHGVGSADI